MSRFLRLSLLPLAALVLLASPRAQAQPANDAFANAWTLPGVSAVTNGNTGQQFFGIPNASKEAGEPNHGGFPGGRSVWFNWTAPGNGTVRIDTIGSQFNTLLGVYTGTAVNALATIASNNDIGGGTNTSRVEFAVVQGTTYRIAVDGRNNNGNGSASGPYILNLQMLASVVITSPTNGTIRVGGGPIVLDVSATVPTPPISRVDFFRNGALIGFDPEAPYSFTDNNPFFGTNTYTAVAVDGGSRNWPSTPVNVTVLNEGLTILSPGDGAVFLNNNPITVSAFALLSSGTLTNVEFYVDGVKFGDDTASPYSLSWSGVTPGVHRLTVIGRTDDGLSHPSPAVFISVARVLVAAGSVWRYLDNGSDQGTAWRAPGFDDSAWTNGPAQLGYGDGDEATVVSFGPDSQNVYVTTYFRRGFTVPDASIYERLVLNVQRDDGAVVYLNGNEAARFNVNAGPVAFNTLVPTAQDDGVGFVAGTAPINLLVDDANVLAVEMHQSSLTSTDVSFDLQLLGVETIIRNLPPEVSLTTPTNLANYFAPTGINLAATASDADGSVTNVAFHIFDLNGSDVVLGHDTSDPYEATWNAPAEGWYYVFAVATDNEGAETQSQPAFVTVYDAAGTPRVQIFEPTNNASFDGPTNLAIFAGTTSPNGVTNVEFRANGVAIGQLAFANPVSPANAPFTWTNATFGTNTLTAVSHDASGSRGTSAPIVIVVIAPPPNLDTPTIATQSPLAGATIGGLTSIQVTFSERVTGVNASDLLINGASATGLTGSGSNYTFTFTQPVGANISITWAVGHGIEDTGYPPIAFSGTGTGETWSYTLTDLTPPTILTRVPAANATVTNLPQVTVTFSEPVAGVDAADFLVNGVPAIGVAGGSASYTFSFSQPPSGPVAISWAGGHGIADLAPSPNPFNAAAATWNYTLDARTILVQSNTAWLFIKGLAEASAPADAWRAPGFVDSGWSNALAPFFYGDAYNTAGNPGTPLTDMQGGYSSVYLRRRFVIENASALTNLVLSAQIDDGFIAWINGVEVARYNMPGMEIAYNGLAVSAFTEPGGNGPFPYANFALPDPQAYLLDGTNVLAVHGFNQSLAGSSDFGWNAQLFTYLADASVASPRLVAVTPAAGDVFYLTNITVRFTEPVSGVDAGDLLIKGMPAMSVSSTTNSTYTFSFDQPVYGPVAITWAAGHGIADFDAPPKPFDGTAPGSTFAYSLLNPSAPTVAAQSPLAGTTINNLAAITITFSEPVVNVDAGDLLVNGVAATNFSGSGASYTFTFPQPAYGGVTIGWASGHGIADLEIPSNDFEPARPGSSWSYTLVDQTAPVVLAQDPPAGAQVTNLTQIAVTFSEPVAGVSAGDLLINGVAATGVSGTGAAYTFSFPQPNATLVNVTWVNGHGIRDLAPVANPFNHTGPGATWSYTTPDNVAPTVASIDPPAFVTVRSLTQIRITFTEAVSGIETNDLLVNGVPARQVGGSGAGPYTFSFQQPSNGPVEVRWVAAHGITDLASPANAFGGGEWNYILDPTATFTEKVILNEIMFNPLGGLPAEEWVELHNVTTGLVNVAGWRFTRGVNFTFPNVALPVGGHLVVAANVAAFQAKYPGVTNVVGGWTGRLANSEETVELETALGELVDSVHYATEGDWARRERGRGAERVTSIAFNGANYTVTIFNHGYTANDIVQISGADQPEYNGRFTPNNIGNSTFTINVPGAPASPATGAILCRQVLDETLSGWSWFSAADGLGSSLELVNSALPNTAGQNWLASTNLHGTPGRANSVATNNSAPLILDVVHAPAIPRSTDLVAITARIQDELGNGVAGVTLFYRNHSTAAPNGFATTNLLDDGGHGDGVMGDGLYGAILPAAANGTIIEFYLQATDTSGHARTWPAPTLDTNGVSGQLANALYQVDNETITNAMPVIRVVMTDTERNAFPPGNRNTDAEMNVTMVSTDGDGTKVRYLGGVRIRGAGSRTRTPPNNRLNIPNDNPWNGLSALNLNGQFVHAQIMGSAVARKSGLPASDARLIQYRINGANPPLITAPINGTGNGAGYGTFVLVEPVNGDLAADLFPDDGDGNVYRASTGNHNADLSYRGLDPSSYLARGYMKTSNQSENDWTDLMNLTFAFSQVLGEADYVQAVRTNLNVELWMRYFAVGSLVSFGETSLFNGRGDDYAMYRGLKDPRFVLVGHDFDTVFGQGDTTTYYPTLTNASIFIMLNPPNPNPNVTTLPRFMTNAAFAPLFYAELKRLCDTVFHPAQINPLFDQLLSGWGTGPTVTTINEMKAHAANRRSQALSQIPLALTVGSTLGTSNGFLYTTASSVTLSGFAHAIDTRQVLVNGVAAGWSAWEARWTHNTALQPGINRVLVQSLNSNNVEFARATIDIWSDDGSVQTVSGALAADTAWSAAGGPYQVTGNLTVPAGITLTIQPGASVYLNSGVDIIVANGGRILAEGTDAARIRFSPAPGGANWGGLTVNGGAGSPETRISHAHFAGNGDTAIHATDGTLFLSHLTFGNTAVQYVSLDRSSFVVQDCVFPSATAAFEPVHGSGGVKAGGRGLFLRNFWGKVLGYNDALDFTGGNRPGPIIEVINNVFLGSDDDLLDLDSTDAWVEGNIFLHTHRNGSPDSASAISGGADNADTSQITAVGNLFYDVDHAANAKQGNFYTLLNNTIVHQTRTGSQDTNTAVVILADQNDQGVFTAEGAGIYLEGNIILDAENLTRHVTAALVTFTNNVIHQLTGTPWAGPGGNNLNADPLLKRIPPFSETTSFTSWAAAQVMWDWFSLQTGSPARGAGPNGRDQGGVIPAGVSISGEPVGRTPMNSATLLVGINRTGNGVPMAGFPEGSGFTQYRWRLDGGVWSAPTPIGTPIALSNLSSGPHEVEAAGRRDSGLYQDDPLLGADARVTVSRSWIVDPSASPLRLNEILANNNGAFVHSNTTPDALELFNSSGSPLDLAGLRLTDDPADPDKFIFPVGASIAAGGYLTVFANNPDGTPGYHLGFGLGQAGDGVYLYNSAESGGVLLDSVRFGLQLTDLSIGRLADGSWTLTQPSLGAANRAARLGDSRALRINEWLAIASAPFENDFIELYNPGSLPVALGGLFLTDEIIGAPDRHQIPALSFLGGFGYQRFLADGDADAGADHLNFSLSGDQGEIGLLLQNLAVIDCVYYQPQRLNISQGRSPDGSTNVVFFDTPTPGAPNPLISITPGGGALVINEVLAFNSTLVEAGRSPDWIELYNGTTGTVSLAGRSLTDNTLQPRRFVFAPGAMLAPGAFLRVLCDSGQPVTNNNTGFGLKSAGGAVYLFDVPANGGSLLSAVTYGLQVADLSIGRVPDGGSNWVLTVPTPDAANAAVPALGDVANLKVNEWLANPPSGEDDWLEIYNPNPLPVALGGLYLTDNLNSRTKHQIAPLSFLGIGTNAWQLFLADGQTGEGADHVNFSLQAGGEAVGISTTNGTLIDGHAFLQQDEGVSQGRFPDGGANVLKFPGTGSPGESNWRRLAEIVINEALTHTDEPLEDAIELRNLTGQPIDVGGWWLSDDNGTLRKYQIPAPTVLPAHGFAVIYETAFTNLALAAIPFALSSGGDEVVLSAATNGALTGFRTRVDFGAAGNGVSFGRHLTSDNREEFVAMSARTFGVNDPGSVEQFRMGLGATNAYPLVGSVVISEIMYHPPDDGITDNTRDEFIELRNLSTVPVALFDGTNGWRLRDAVDFDFPPGTTIAASETILVVSFDPVNSPGTLAAFRAAYSLATTVPILGPYAGKLANDADDLELRRPDAPNLEGVPYILVERVRYFDTAPWPDADGNALSLTRVSDTGFGNDATNWVAATPTPGPVGGSQDSDNDGIPNVWESAYSFDPFNAADAALDSDGDGLTNLEEFQAGTHPRDAQSALALTLRVQSGAVEISFHVVSNHTYQVQLREAVDMGSWYPLATVEAGSYNGLVTIMDTNPVTRQRFYRVLTPAPPETNSGPTVLESPSSQDASLGDRVHFNVIAVGAGQLQYQWYCGPKLIAGEWGSSLEITNVSAQEAGRYIAKVTDPTGTSSSLEAPLQVKPVILMQPEDQTAAPGQPAQFAVEAHSTEPLQYRWYRNNRLLAGETNAVLLLPAVQLGDEGAYHVVVRHQTAAGPSAATSRKAQLRVTAAP